ncbi:MAG: MBL fold metallo-hydrolase [Candidatus Micrarchaeaceae archaeon]
MKDERSVMFDYGIKIDHKNEYPIGLPKIDAFVLSHAHLDHSGYAPAIYENMHVPAFGTEPTLELSTLLLDDAINIAKKQHTNLGYYKRQVNMFNNKYVPLRYHKRFAFGDYDIEFFDAGHICGSAITLLERTKAKDYKRVVYTGDFKLGHQTLHEGAEIVKSDLLIIESTYESKEHPDRNELIKHFIDEIKGVLDDGGTALIPSFAVGRSQELLSILYKNGLADMTYVDGMCRAATKIVAKHKDFISNPELLSEGIKEATWIDDVKARKEVFNRPSIVLTTAGMLNGGPVLSYLTRLNKDSRIFITGYQVEGTNGRSLIDTGGVTIDRKRLRVETPVSVYDFSAHAGDSDLHKFVRESSPNAVVCVHGDPERTQHFAAELRGEGFDAYAPKVGDVIDFG